MKIFQTISLLLLSNIWVLTNIQSQATTELQSRREYLERQIEIAEKYLKSNEEKKQHSLKDFKIISTDLKNREEVITTVEEEIELLNNQVTNQNQRVDQLTEKASNTYQSYKALVNQLLVSKITNQDFYQLLSIKSLKEYIIRQSLSRQLESKLKNELQVYNQQIASIQEAKDSIDYTLRSKKELLERSDEEKEQLNSKLLEKKKLLEKLEKSARQLNNEIAQSKKEKKNLNSLISNSISVAKPTVATKSIKLNSKLNWPTDNGYISEKFGENPHPFNDQIKIQNDGVQITCAPNSLVRTIYAGDVTAVHKIAPGNHVVIIKNSNLFFVYANLAVVVVEQGQTLDRETVIGRVGGGDVGTLAFQIWDNQKKINPEKWLNEGK